MVENLRNVVYTRHQSISKPTQTPVECITNISTLLKKGDRSKMKDYLYEYRNGSV